MITTARFKIGSHGTRSCPHRPDALAKPKLLLRCRKSKVECGFLGVLRALAKKKKQWGGQDSTPISHLQYDIRLLDKPACKIQFYFVAVKIRLYILLPLFGFAIKEETSSTILNFSELRRNSHMRMCPELHRAYARWSKVRRCSWDPLWCWSSSFKARRDIK